MNITKYNLKKSEQQIFPPTPNIKIFKTACELENSKKSSRISKYYCYQALP